MEKYGIGFWGLSTLANDDFSRIDIAKRLGFNSIDVDLTKIKDDLSDIKLKEYYNKIYNYGKENGVEFFQTHAPYTSFPNYILSKYFKSIVRSIKITSYLHCKYMVLHPQIFDQVNYNTNFDDKELEFNIEFIKKLIPYLKKYNVKLCVENVYDWDKSVNPKKIRLVYYSYPENLRKLIDKINSPYVGICLDTGHMNLAKVLQSKAIEIFNDKLFVLHIHDNYGVKDDHFRINEGNINWKDFFNSLKKINYAGVFNLEIKPLSTEIDFYQKAIDDLKLKVQKYYD